MHIVKVDTKETESPVNEFSSLFPYNGFIFTTITKEKSKNPLFLQPDRSFDFGMKEFSLSVYCFFYTPVSTP